MGQVLKLASDHPLLDVTNPKAPNLRERSGQIWKESPRFGACPDTRSTCWFPTPPQRSRWRKWRGMRNVTLVVALLLLVCHRGQWRASCSGVRRLERIARRIGSERGASPIRQLAKSEFMAAVSHELQHR